MIENIRRLHTTPMGAIRIRRNLGLDTDDVTGYCKQLILKSNARIERKGKNLYVKTDNAILTVNASSFTIITAHKL